MSILYAAKTNHQLAALVHVLRARGKWHTARGTYEELCRRVGAAEAARMVEA
jgi:hypothetical protein